MYGHQPGLVGIALPKVLILVVMLAVTLPLSGGYLNPPSRSCSGLQPPRQHAHVMDHRRTTPSARCWPVCVCATLSLRPC